MKDKPIKPAYLHLDEKINAIDYLEKAHIFIKQTENDNMAWKWAIISLYTALYGFAVCACAGTSPEIVAKKNKKGKHKGERQLISLSKALRYCQDPSYMERYVFSKHLILNNEQIESIDWLKDKFRHQFEHFWPKGWSIELHGMPHILIDVLDIIRFLAIDTHNIRFTQTQRRKIKSSIFQSKKTLKISKLYIETEQLDNQ
ncbi:MAG: hypothetical protein IH964_02855 [Candidatus Dadabacteria bacterium]|nr:hypothetical protein [Candidatus Dadabacteria bacterium]